MKFQNTNAVCELNFSVLGKTYKVEAGGEVDVDPAHVPYVIRRGLQLEPAVFKPKPKTDAPKPASGPKAPVAPKPSAPAAATKPVEPAKPSE